MSIKCEVKSVGSLACNTFKILLQPEAPIEFKAGQYLLAVMGEKDKRPFSIASSPCRENELELHIGAAEHNPYAMEVVEAMKKNQATFGFEGNGGGVSGEIMMTRDGGSTVIKILNIMKETGKPLSQLVGALPKFFIFKTKVDCPWKIVPLIINKAKEEFKGMKTEELDGLKIWVDKTNWILFRSSSNAPEFRVFTEASSQAEATKLGQKGIELVEEVIRKEAK